MLAMFAAAAIYDLLLIVCGHPKNLRQFASLVELGA
jgi:hypothetical protein